jgi:3-dehydroquinate dehydratase-1
MSIPERGWLFNPTNGLAKKRHFPLLKEDSAIFRESNHSTWLNRILGSSGWMELPLVCVVLSGCTVDGMLKDAAMATASGADLVEVRLDRLWVKEVFPEPTEEASEDSKPRRNERREPEYVPQPLDSVDLSDVLDSFKQGLELPVIITCRSESQGGYFPGTEEERLDVLREGIKSGPSWVDLEFEIEEKARKKLADLASGKTKVICSQHSSERPPPAAEIVSEVEEMSKLGEMVKICHATGGTEGSLRLFEAAWELKESGIRNSIMGMGSGGDWPRIHAPLLHQHMVYSTMQVGWHLAYKGKINKSDLSTAWKLLGYTD